MTTSRELPDVRDGLPLVHRRVLVAMRDAGVGPDRPHRRSLAVLHEVRKRFRPHTRVSPYDALLAMLQDFTSRYPLIEGHGNFGSIEGDPAAAPTYTEVRLSPIAMELLADTERVDGYTESGPLGSAFPNLIVNGSLGTVRKTTTNIPSHNLREVVDAAIFLIDNPDATSTELRALLPGPDLPTGGIIWGHEGITAYQESGRGRIIVRARLEIDSDDPSGRTRIAITELPYGVIVAPLLETIADLVRDHVIDGITDLRNESDRVGMRVVIVLKRDTPPHAILEQLYERTSLQTTIDVDMTALVPQPETGQLVPVVLTLKDLLEHFIEHRDAVIAGRMRLDGTNGRPQRMHVIKDELRRIAEMYGDDRRTTIDRRG